VCIPGHTARILGSYLHDMFQSWYSSFVAMTQLENHMLQPCLLVGMYKIFELFFQNLINSSLFDGWNVQWSRNLLSKKGSRLRLAYLLSSCSIVIGCTTNAPDVSSPRGYGWVLVADHRLQFILLLSVEFFLKIVFSIGCAASAPDGSSPRGYSRNFLGIGSKIYILSPVNFLLQQSWHVCA
jgi:hypothetical protein